VAKSLWELSYHHWKRGKKNLAKKVGRHTSTFRGIRRIVCGRKFKRRFGAVAVRGSTEIGINIQKKLIKA